MRLTSRIQCVFTLLILCISFAACDSTDPVDAPAPPQIIRASDTAQVHQVAEVVAVAVSGDGAPLTYEIDWGDDRGIQSVTDVESGLYVTLTNRYFDPGTYRMRCRVIDVGGRTSTWSREVILYVYGETIIGRGDWWMYMHDAQHTGRSAFVGPQSPVLLWKYQIASPVRSSATFDAFGHIYVGADDFQLHAILPDGRSRWQYWSGNARIQNAPAIAHDGAACFGGSSANIYRVNRYGIKEWNYSPGAAVLTSNAALDDDDALYIGSEDGSLYCLESDGTRRWNIVTSGPITGSPVLTRDMSHVYFGSMDHILYAADRNGSVVWTYPTSGPISGSPSIGPLGTIFIGSEDGYLYALSPDGKLIWKRNLQTPLRSTPAIGIQGRVFCVSSGGVLFCFDNEGTLLWDNPFTTSGSFTSPALDVLETCYVADAAGRLYAISSAGKLLWQYDTDAPVYAAPSIGPNGVVLVGNDDGFLFAIGEQ